MSPQMMTRREIRIWKINFKEAGIGQKSSHRPITKIRVAPNKRIFILGRNTPFNKSAVEKAR